MSVPGNHLLLLKNLSFAFTLVLCACTGDNYPSESPLTEQSSLTENIDLPSDDEFFSITPTPNWQYSSNHSYTGSLHRDEEALEFSFPTPASEAISLWRPPLYPVPWALNPFDHFFFVRPIAADEINWPLANYRYGGIFFGTDIVHTGIDIPAPRYTPVYASGAGKVSWAG